MEKSLKGLCIWVKGSFKRGMCYCVRQKHKICMRKTQSIICFLSHAIWIDVQAALCLQTQTEEGIDRRSFFFFFKTHCCTAAQRPAIKILHNIFCFFMLSDGVRWKSAFVRFYDLMFFFVCVLRTLNICSVYVQWKPFMCEDNHTNTTTLMIIAKIGFGFEYKSASDIDERGRSIVLHWHCRKNICHW